MTQASNIWKAKNRESVNKNAREHYQKVKNMRAMSMARYRHLHGKALRPATLQKLGITHSENGPPLFTCFSISQKK